MPDRPAVPQLALLACSACRRACSPSDGRGRGRGRGRGGTGAAAAADDGRACRREGELCAPAQQPPRVACRPTREELSQRQAVVLKSSGGTRFAPEEVVECFTACRGWAEQRLLSGTGAGPLEVRGAWTAPPVRPCKGSSASDAAPRTVDGCGGEPRLARCARFWRTLCALLSAPMEKAAMGQSTLHGVLALPLVRRLPLRARCQSRRHHRPHHRHRHPRRRFLWERLVRATEEAFDCKWQ